MTPIEREVIDRVREVIKEHYNGRVASFAHAYGIPERSLYRWLHGKSKPSKVAVLYLRKILEEVR